MPRIAPAVALAVAVFLLVFGALAWLGYLNDWDGESPAPTATAVGTITAASHVAVTPAPTASSTGGSLATESPASTAPPAVLVGAGDIADCASDGDEATAALLDAIPGTVFTLGDNVYENGTASEFASCYDPSWGRPSVRERTRPAPGNHDYNTQGARGYFDYFGSAAGDPGRGYYAYDHGTWRVYVLNSNCAAVGGCAAGSAQEQWLRADLAANPRACALAMWHHPRFSSGEHGNDTMTEDFWRALYDADAELVLTGHDHDYERFAPQTPTGALDDARGLVEIVVGTGGRSLRGFGTVRDNSLVRASDTWGVLRLTLSAGSFAFDFVPASPSLFTDSGSGSCH